MATPNYTEEEIQFRKRARRRLVGAVVLVVLVVAGVPLILPADKPQQDTQQIDIRIPSQDATGYAPKIMPAPSVEQPPPAAPEKPAITIPPAALNAAPALPPSKTGPIEKPVEAVPPVKAVHDAPKPAVAAKQTFYVQYGAFSESKNAKQRQTELKTKGVPTFTEVVKTSAGNKIRVRSGPYASRAQAEKVREKVKPLDSKLVVTGDTP
ncbi:MAG: SPOR domain-containing protein [Burkholderiales bacterium]